MVELSSLPGARPGSGWRRSRTHLGGLGLLLLLLLVSGVSGCESTPPIAPPPNQQSLTEALDPSSGEARPESSSAAALHARRPGVFVAPLNVFAAIDPALQPGAERVAKLVVAYLEAHGRRAETLSVFDYREAFTRAADAAGKANQGQELSKQETEKAVYRELYRELGGGLDFEILVTPDLMVRGAKLKGKSARWDGVRRRQKGPAGYQWSGGTQGASLRVRIFDGEGARIFQGFGGLDLLFEPNIREKKMQLVDDLLSDRKKLSEGVAIAFDPYLPRKSSFIRR